MIIDNLVCGQGEEPSKKRGKPEPALKKATIASMIKRKTPAAASASKAVSDRGTFGVPATVLLYSTVLYCTVIIA